MPYTAICQVMELSCSSVRRWRSRIRQQRPAVARPGVRKVGAISLDVFNAEAEKLCAVNSRTHGAGALCKKYAWNFSQRDMQAVLNAVRREKNQQKRMEMVRIDWRIPNMTWAMDDTLFGHNEQGAKQFLHCMQDMATTFKFEPLTGACPTGAVIAEHILATGRTHGFPLFIKEDNSGNQISSEVRAVLEANCVLFLPNPPWYPQYNGAQEHGNGEMKNRMREQIAPAARCPDMFLRTIAFESTHYLNHLNRDKLNGGIACARYHGRGYRSYLDMRERRSVYEWLIDKQNAILLAVKARDGDVTDRDASEAWREAAMIWLWKNEFVKVMLNGEVLPYLNWKGAHK